MNVFENQAGFTITANKLQVVEINQNDNQFILENVDEAYFNEPLNPDEKETKIRSLLQGAYNELQIKHAINSISVSFTLPFEIFHTMQVPYDNTLLNQDLIEEFRWEFSILYPYIHTKELAIQYFEIDKSDLTPFNTALVVAVHRKFIKIIHAFCLENNLKLKFIDNIHIASDRALSLSQVMDKGIILSLYITNKNLSVIYYLNGKPVYQRIIHTNDASEIPELVKQELSAKESFIINTNMIDTSYISGEDLSAAFIKTLSNIVKLDFIHFNPFDKIKPGPKLYDNRLYSEKFNSFSAAAGIAFRLA